MTTEKEKILSAMSEQFMEPSFTDEQDWYEVETTCGTQFIPADMVGTLTWDEESESYINQDKLDMYCEGRIITVETRKGFGARLSAPGYMDCTEWSVFATLAEAEQYIVDTYGDDIEIEES